MMEDYQKQVLDYFAAKSSAYDDVECQLYWRLSDELLWSLLDTLVLRQLQSDFTFLDAGGGTGRWSERILLNYSNTTGTIRDISAAMLTEAYRRQDRLGADRLQVVHASVEPMSDIEDSSFDIVFNFHNVIGFLSDPHSAISEFSRVLKQDGYLVTVAPNMYHMAFFNIMLDNLISAETAIERQKGKFTKEMPELQVFTPQRLRDFYHDAGLRDVRVLGFPKLIFPGFLETQLEGNTASHVKLLENSENFKKVLALEKMILFHEDAATRGNNLWAVGQKT